MRFFLFKMLRHWILKLAVFSDITKFRVFCFTNWWLCLLPFSGWILNLVFSWPLEWIFEFSRRWLTRFLIPVSCFACSWCNLQIIIFNLHQLLIQMFGFLKELLNFYGTPLFHLLLKVSSWIKEFFLLLCLWKKIWTFQ